MHITERIWLVGSGRLGFQSSNGLDCNVYLVDGGGEYALIDAGAGVEPERIVANIERAGVAMRDVRHLLLTHAHADHAAGAQFFHARYGLEVVCAAEARPWVETGDEVKTSLGVAREAGVYPADFVYPPCPVARTVVEGDTIQVGDLGFGVLETPGHSHGHISFLLERAGVRALFGGDSVFAGGKVVLQNIWDCSISEYAATLDKLERLAIDQLFAGHGTFLLEEAHTHIVRADRAFKKLRLPPGL